MNNKKSRGGRKTEASKNYEKARAFEWDIFEDYQVYKKKLDWTISEIMGFGSRFRARRRKKVGTWKRGENVEKKDESDGIFQRLF